MSTADDPQRPGFHLTAPYGWLNDPNGLAQRDGTFHAFYQHNPYACVHGDVRGVTAWGHATSTDLLHWDHLPVALLPDTGEDAPDRDGCWSGVLVDDHGTPTLVYSGNRRGEGQRPCLATSDDPDLRTWTKDPGNPVLDPPPDGVTEFRDHCVWREGDEWRQVVSAGLDGVGGAALLFGSADLHSWAYRGPLATGPLPGTGETGDGDAWECVDVFPLGHGRHAMTFGVWREGRTLWTGYAVGHLVGDTLSIDRSGVLDAGLRYFYAPQSFLDERGRRVMVGWLQEGRSDEACEEAGWSGALSVPRVVSLGDDDDLHSAPVEEVATLRGEAHPVDLDGSRDGGRALSLDRVGVRLDLEAELALEPGAELEVGLRRTPDDAERTLLHLQACGSELRFTLARDQSTLEPGPDTSTLRGRAPYDGRPVTLRVLVDHSTVEVFVAGRPLSARVYPSRSDAEGVTLELSPAGGRVTGTVWTLSG